MMRVFVAGATGTLGVPVVRALVAAGHHVTGLTRSAEKRGMLERLGAVPAIADALDAAALDRVVREAAPTHVLHLLTALPRNGPVRLAHVRPTLRLKTEGTANLLKAAIAAGAKRMVGESIIYAYGFAADRLVTEADPPGGPEAVPWLNEVVAGTRSLEDQMLAADRAGLIEAIPLRFGFFYGAESPSTEFSMRMLRMRGLPVVRGADDGRAGFIHLDDATSATIAALERGRAGEIYNVVDSDPVSMNEFFRRAARESGAPAPWRLPLWIARLTMPYAATMMTTRLAVSNEKAIRDLGWQPVYPSSVDGLKQVVRALAGP
ncbi:NAD-dependent epimerase/dehydratase family protein [Longimicrobium terrae]|uniref:Nucleoside-diphosphate-sugar epimerase n=1 Tax=Longimicrobium terrae TaxID=1639882 RepID=A0A841H7S0_9BACT|nr:NAD-dependent epimerase/dehydratase family protein [Longimicrobium terrae]MBB4639614.1 nucleoside-diphosphate-sugar epimerase [Longimicrobium terrae]MBB6073983.1 nucleoside-diphosphate-sugar epimerase [Longimicrobium terrae]NNC28303.1 NAD-dependent epimerase/dehydratase family protein [Longimicrobium terrae]